MILVNSRKFLTYFKKTLSKKFEQPERAFNRNQLKSLILAQDERWRRA